MEIPDKTEPGNENKYSDVNSVGHVHPAPGYGSDNSDNITAKEGEMKDSGNEGKYKDVNSQGHRQPEPGHGADRMAAKGEEMKSKRERAEEDYKNTADIGQISSNTFIK